MGYEINPTNSDCYEGTSILINKFGIKNQDNLDEIETLIVSLKSAQIEMDFDTSAELDFEFYKNIHRQLFSEIYEWAGSVRKINLSKKRTNFCPCEQIESLGVATFTRLINMKYFSLLSGDKLIEEFADLYNNINYLHPFREGNGRAQRLFLRLLCQKIGYNLDFDAIDHDELMTATIHASEGVLDGLKNIFVNIIKNNKD